MATAAEMLEQATRDMEQAAELATKAKELRKQAERLAREERQALAAAQAKAHRDRMYAEIGQGAGLTEDQHDIVYAQAYEQGHAHGDSQIESYYVDFAEMARKLLDAR